ncbi:DUF3800 domain-containing protein [Leptospira kanakyensis]|uniref:DUF3800 domain-containing protein n=1 Tax=Leptospira kanakyensis TaxID=2484968 RepID=A0A6N4PWM6_9LEPT|nr:DUF3800 domain-containing protein [Leptospira kanakyensis]TGK65304.1 DUF3800 domain-containing protein [Leptospira kanakyensis]
MYSVYVDESGNTGARYIDDEQPIYVLAGWVIKQPEPTRELINYLKRFQGQSERKASTLFRNYNWPKTLSETFAYLGSLRSYPTYIIVYKRYLLAAKLIETLLDPLYNKLVPNKFSFDMETKKEWAMNICELTSLSKFDNGLKNIDHTLIKESVQEIIIHLKRLGNKDFETYLKGSIESLEQNPETNGIGNHKETKRMNSLNGSIAISLFNQIEHMGRLVNEDFTIIHDENAHYEGVFNLLFDSISDGEKKDYLLSNGGIMHSGYERLKKIHFAKSEESPWLQMADLLAGAISRSIKHILSKNTNELDSNLKDLITKLFPALIDPFPHAEFIGPPKIFEKIVSTIL